MPRVLLLVTSARWIEHSDGSCSPTGYFPEDALSAYERFIAAGLGVVVATPDGAPPCPDPYALEPMFHYPAEDADFLLSVIRSFRRFADDIRVTLQQHTELDLIAARRLFEALKAAGAPPEQARSWIEEVARTAWNEGRNFADVLSEHPEVAIRLPVDRIRTVAAQLRDDSALQASAVAERLASIPDFRTPVPLTCLDQAELESFCALFVPGGHGSMMDLAHSPEVGEVVRSFHRRQAVIAAVCHGPAALLPAGPGPSGEWLFDGYRLTALSDQEELQTAIGRRGLTWYLETALKNAGAVFDDAPSPWRSHVVVDRNLITAQNANSAHAIADALLKKLGVLSADPVIGSPPPWPEPIGGQLSPAFLVKLFFERLSERDLLGLLALIDPGAEIEIVPLAIRGPAKTDGFQFFHALFEAFPDARMPVRSLFAGADDVVVAETTFEGTQAADFFGVVNQEKHVDVDQGWIFRVADGRIIGLRGYWCQNQFYRRLGVKRLDHVTITA